MLTRRKTNHANVVQQLSILSSSFAKQTSNKIIHILAEKLASK